MHWIKTLTCLLKGVLNTVACGLNGIYPVMMDSFITFPLIIELHALVACICGLVECIHYKGDQVTEIQHLKKCSISCNLDKSID